MSGRILVTTNRLQVAGGLKDAFEAEGYQVELVPRPDQVTGSGEARLLILSGVDGETDAAAWLELAREELDVPIFAVVQDRKAVDRLRGLGASEVFGPEADPDEVLLLADRTLKRRRLQSVTGIVGESDSMREALERVVQIAPVDSTALITGESGTGKELVARGIHALSPRRHRGFLAINVAALSDTLLESELFGHEKGAFTGAIDARKGFFELAHRGTLFLDEIGEMPLSTQTKLLRVLEQREFLRVGGERPIEVDVRIIAATNQDLRALVRTGRFRRDLYYRLNILNIELPPLRDRQEDIPLLIQHFVRDLGSRLQRVFPGLTPDAMEMLVRYDWPGNVRELRNMVESMVVLAPRRPIAPRDLPQEIRFPREGRRLLPAPISVPLASDADTGPGSTQPASHADSTQRFRPELEFVFRTLVDLRMDVDQLRAEFDAYREDTDDRLPNPETRYFALPPHLEVQGPSDRDGLNNEMPTADLGESDVGETVAEGTVVFHPGMTIEEMEQEAILSVLREMGGNRRKAAESLGIGERTLYRKIQKYGIED